MSCYGCEVWLLKTEEQRKPLALEMDYLTTAIRSNWNGLDTSLEWKIVFGQRRITSGHRLVGGEEEDRNNHRGTK